MFTSAPKSVIAMDSEDCGKIGHVLWFFLWNFPERIISK